MSTQDTHSSGAPRVLSGRYEIHRRIARGGMAEVLLARDRSLDRPVAVKVLFPEFSTDQTFVERFRREAQAAANLTHPNIVAVYDWGAENGTYFIVMEFVDGQSLADVTRTARPLHPRRAAEVAFEVAGALGFAHSRGVVHRDVKPGNVLISSNGVAKVTDFGIARALSSPSEDLTAAGAVMGTASYFSPEQAQGFAVDARSDLYSLGVVLFEMVAGRTPFAGDSPVAIAYKHVQETPPRPSEFVSGVPVGLEAIIGRLLAKNPDHRYLSAEDLRADLRRWLDGDTPRALAAAQSAEAAVPASPVDPGATQVAMTPVSAVTTGQQAATRATGPLGPQYAGAADSGEPYDDPMPPRRTGLFVGLLVVLLAVVAGLAFWLVKSLNENDTSTPNIAVPKLVGLTRDEAKSRLDGLKLKVTFDDEASDIAPEGQVVDQDPPEGTKVAAGDRVSLKVSTGPATATIPGDLTGLSAEDAVGRLKTLLFTNVTRKDVNDDTLAAGQVVGTDPAGGTKVALSSPIVVKVSIGPAGQPIPDVAGKTQSQARKLLSDNDFVVGDIKVQASSTVDKGLVIGTDPSGSAPAGSTVNLIVSGGPEQVTVPGVKGQSEADATAVLRSKNLVVEVETKALPASDPNVGRVTAVDPGVGSSVDVGSTVTITVGVATASATTTTAGGSTTTTTTGP